MPICGYRNDMLTMYDRVSFTRHRRQAPTRRCTNPTLVPPATESPHPRSFGAHVTGIDKLAVSELPRIYPATGLRLSLRATDSCARRVAEKN